MTIVAKTPLRITLAGGGTDFPPFARRYGGQAITAAINHYVTVMVKAMWDDGYAVKYATTEHATTVEAISHPIVRSACLFYDVPDHTEIISLADIPGGTGLGSSGAFTVALCAALSRYVGWSLDQTTLAEHAALIELEILKRGGGPQDHYACALGDVQILYFNADGSVRYEPLLVEESVIQALENQLHLYFVGWGRNADTILTKQTTDGLHEIKGYGQIAQKMLEYGDVNGFGELLNDHWYAKKRRFPVISNPQIDECYEAGLAAGALGGKLVGAGGGGFIIFCSNDAPRLSNAMAAKGLREVPFAFDNLGVTVCKL